MSRADLRLRIVGPVTADPFRREEDREIQTAGRVLCVECRHVRVRDHQVGRNLRYAYECGARPLREEHVNFVDGGATYFDREGWERNQEYVAKGYEWARGKGEADFFHGEQNYPPCVEHNPDGLCDLHEVKAEVAARLPERRAARWKIAATGTLALWVLEKILIAFW